MRIIAGEAKNRIIKTRKGFDTRPTLESVKESLFSIIAPYIENSVFLDLVEVGVSHLKLRVEVLKELS